MGLPWMLAAVGLAAGSGVPGLFSHWRRSAGARFAALMMILAACCGVTGSAVCLTWAADPGGSGGTSLAVAGEMHLPWKLLDSALIVRADPLSAFFFIPLFFVAALGAIYGLGYYGPGQHPRTFRQVGFFYGWLIAGLGLVLLAGSSLVFLAGWEVMAISAFFLIGAEHHRPAARQAAFVYLAATHVSTLSLFALFGLCRHSTGSFELSALTQAGPGLRWAIFLLALLAFGLKAGVMPLHFWLPAAHANAPSHVSAIMSGLLIKIGIYGLLRITSLLPDPPLSWGLITLVLGCISGVGGVLFALGQHDLKRLLAYHSIENIGIIVIGLGLALLGRSLHQQAWVILGLGGALLHVWNHGLFKALLFLGAGAVIHQCHTREIDALGGLAKQMPQTAACFLVGAVAICGLPPLNGFVSELFIYLGLLGTVDVSPAQSFPVAGLAVVALSLIGALALACFVKVFAAVFLGQGRSHHTAHAGESPATMGIPMVTLAVSCAAIGLFPVLLGPILNPAVAVWQNEPLTLSLASAAPLRWISGMAAALWLLLGLLAWWLYRHLAARPAATAVTWGCGYPPSVVTARIQYTSSSFAQSLVHLGRWVLRPQEHSPHLRMLFPGHSGYHSYVPEVVLDRCLLPLGRTLSRALGKLRVIQQGHVQQYIFYILACVMILLAWWTPWYPLLLNWLQR